MSTSTVLLSLFKHKAWGDEALFAALGKLDLPAHEAERRIAIRLLNHIHVADRIFSAHLCGRAHAHTATHTPETPALEDLRAATAEPDRWYIDCAASIPADALAERLAFTYTDGDNGRMSREEMLLHVTTHGSCHRGAVGRILAQASLPPPRDSLSVYLHKAEPQRRARS